MKLVFIKKKNLQQEKLVLDHSHESDSTIDHQAVSNNIKWKISKSNISEMPSKIIIKKLGSLENDTQILTNEIQNSWIQDNKYKFLLEIFLNNIIRMK